MKDRKYIVTFQETRAVHTEVKGINRADVEAKARAWLAEHKEKAPWKAQAIIIKNVKMQNEETYERAQ